MLTFILRRAALAVVTLVVLSLIVFLSATLLPGDPGRATLGPLASPSAVTALNHQYGVDRPLPEQYWNYISGFVRGDMGTSYTYQAPVRPLLFSAIGRSAKLAFLAFIVVVPLGIFLGLVAALNVGKTADRLIVIMGTSAGVIPEFVTGIIVLLAFGVGLSMFPISATWPSGTGPFGQVYHLILPAIPLIFLLFGYIARMARAGAIEALASDYVRTATLKGLPRRVVIFRHVLRNSLLPTITVVANLTGYLIGGLVIVETLFHYNGIGTIIYNAANAKDFPMLEAGVLTIGVWLMFITLAADLLYSLLNPRIRVRGTE